MHLSTVLSAVNNNPKYYKFMPHQILFWKLFGVKFVAIYVGDVLPEELEPYRENIIIWQKNRDLDSVFVAQNIRLYYPALLKLPEDQMVMITDMDMLPCNREYFCEGLEPFNKKHFIYYRGVETDNIYMCYNASHPDTWGQIFDIKSESDVEKELDITYKKYYVDVPKEKSWFTDQAIFYEKLKRYFQVVVLNRIVTRLETPIFEKYLEQGYTNFYTLYDDCHFWKDYIANSKLIKNAEMQLRKKYDPNWKKEE